MRPKDFWKLNPEEFWLLVEVRKPVKRYGSLTESEADELLEALNGAS